MWSPEFHSRRHINGLYWFTPAIPALWRLDKDDLKLSEQREFKATPKYQKPVLMTKQKIKIFFSESEKPQKDEGVL